MSPYRWSSSSLTHLPDLIVTVQLHTAVLTSVVPVIKRVVGLRHPVTLRACVGLAWWTGQAGHPDGARTMFTALLPLVEQVFGPDHPETLATRANLDQLA